jgi:hypothetical protein
VDLLLGATSWLINDPVPDEQPTENERARLTLALWVQFGNAPKKKKKQKLKTII